MPGLDHGRTVTRREFLYGTLAGAAMLEAVNPNLAASRGSMQQNHAEVPRRTLGRTGEAVSVIGLGGAHIGQQKDENESIRLIRSAIDSGINFLDSCWD